MSIQIQELKSVPLSSLKPHPKNPRDIDEEAFAALKKLLEKFGLVEPLVWNKRSGYVLGGHQRLRALKEAGLKNVNVAVVDLDETAEIELMLGLNNPNAQGNWTSGLGDLLETLKFDIGGLYEEMRLNALEDLIPMAPQSFASGSPGAAFGAAEPYSEEGAVEGAGEEAASEAGKPASDYPRMFALMVANSEWEPLQENLKFLGEKWGKTVQADVVVEAVKYARRSLNG